MSTVNIENKPVNYFRHDDAPSRLCPVEGASAFPNQGD